MANGLLRCGGFVAAVVALLAGPAGGFAQKGKDKDTVPGKIWVLQIKESGAKEWDRSVQHRVEGFKVYPRNSSKAIARANFPDKNRLAVVFEEGNLAGYKAQLSLVSNKPRVFAGEAKKEGAPTLEFRYTFDRE